MTTTTTDRGIEEAIADLRKADKIIKRRTRYACGLVGEQEKEGLAPQADFFFESPDGQNYELYTELRKLGYSSGGYNAPYYWKIVKNGIAIAFTEGDIYISRLKTA